MKILKQPNLMVLPSHTEQARTEMEIAGWVDKLKGVPAKAKDGIKHEFKHQVHHIAENLGTTKASIITAFQEPKPMNILKACGYSFATLYGAYHMAHKVAEEGALHVIAHLAEHNAAHKVGHAAGHKLHKVQDAIKKYPVLSKLTGPALAGTMLYGYMMTEPHSLGDWNMANVKKAFTGEFGIADFLGTPEAVALGVNVATGKALSLTAIAENVSTLALGMVATAIVESENPKLKKIGESVKGFLNTMKSKRSPLHDIETSKDFTGTKETMGIDPREVTHGGPKKKGDSKDEDKAKPAKSEDKPIKKLKDKPKPDEAKDTKKPAGDGTWWDSMSKAAKKAYLKDHPDSIYHSKA